jgi:hypothetical protein
MPFGLGFFATAGGAAGGPPAFELISTQLVTGSVASVTFSSIPATYKHLQVRALIRGTDSTSNLDFIVRLNGDSGSNYSRHNLYGNGSGVLSVANINQTGMVIENLAGGTSTSSNYSPIILDLLDYASTAKNSTIRTMSGNAASSNLVSLSSGLWRNTAAVTSISFTPNALNIISGSRFSIYGIKGE